jgi:hypothetical protein
MDGMTERALLEPEAIARSSVVRSFMRRCVEEHRDHTGEVCAATLAKSAAVAFDLYDDAAAETVPRALLDAAAQVARQESTTTPRLAASR